MDEEAFKLAGRAVELLDELQGDDEDADDRFDDLKEKRRDTTRFISQGSAAQALQAAMMALEMMFLGSRQVNEQLLPASLREITWLAKDAAALFKDSDNHAGRVAALLALARAHLARAQEPDAPMAALKAGKDAVAASRGLGDASVLAKALCALGDAHLAKATATPFEKVLLEEIRAATNATREAEEVFKSLNDQRGVAQALHGTARALLRHTDEDEVMDGERLADEAREIFHDLGDRASEVHVFLTGIAARQASSGPASALMLAQDAGEDWQAEGNRPKDAGLALLLAAGFQLEVGDLDNALRLCDESSALYDRAGSRRGVATTLEVRSSVMSAKKKTGDALNALEEMAAIFEKLGDGRSQGESLMMAANLLLNELSDEVDSDSQAEFNKKTPQNGIDIEEVQKRSADGLEFAHRASKCFEDAEYEEGTQAVTELVQRIYERAIRIYCKCNEPDQIYYTLDKDTPKEDPTKCIREWKIPMPSMQKTEGLDKGDGFLHVFDPHPPAGH